MSGRIRNVVKRYLPEIFWNPIYLSTRALRTAIEQAIENANVQPSEKWLDLGCGLRPYEAHFPQGCYVGLDVETSGRDESLKAPDYLYDGEVFPFEDSSFSGLLSTEVFEHVPNPETLITEAFRVVKPGGRFILSTPFVWREHEVPYDFFRYTSYGMTELLTRQGFVVEEVTKTTGALETLAMNFIAYIINDLTPKSRVVGGLVTLLICFPIQLIVLVLSKVLPDKKQLFVNLVISARKPEKAAAK